MVLKNSFPTVYIPRKIRIAQILSDIRNSGKEGTSRTSITRVTHFSIYCYVKGIPKMETSFGTVEGH